MKSAEELNRTQMTMQHNNDMENLNYRTELNAKEVDSQNQIYAKEASSPVYETGSYQPQPAYSGGYMKKTKKDLI